MHQRAGRGGGWLCLALMLQACGDGGNGDGADAVQVDAGPPDGAVQCTEAVTCDDGNPCTLDDCVAHACVHVDADAGTACDDGDACTASSACAAGTCVGADPVVCTALDQCHDIGVCDPATGACPQPVLDDGTACDDGDACTQTDTCQAGSCTGADQVTCTAIDQCHLAGACDPGTGACSQPTLDDDTACDDGDACTQTDTCQAGTCTGADAVECVAIDQCHVVGACDPGTGTCSAPNADDNVACDDGDLCTQSDTCQAGSCTGANPVTCTALDDCRAAGTCDPGTGACDDPPLDATACADGAGTCVAGTCDLDPVTLVFVYIGARESWTVPAGIHSVHITAWGAQGHSNAQSILGGLGGQAEGDLAVTPGDVLTIFVGGGGVANDPNGGQGGGGSAGTSPCAAANGGGGGGASDVRVGSTGLDARVIVGAGGGGAAGSRINGCGRGTGGGGGGGYYGGGGGAAWPQNSTVVPTGGSQTTGGIGGTSTYAPLAPANNGSAGVAGFGGHGGHEIDSAQGTPMLGSQGAIGGGAAGSDGTYAGTFTGQSGAGGSSYVGGVTNGVTTPGVNAGTGLVRITYDLD